MAGKRKKRPKPKMCKPCGKRIHVYEVDAIGVAIWGSAIFGKPYRMYECPMGKGWHLTTKNKMGPCTCCPLTTKD